jgi:predicted metal-dependent enzyme (double-stranded beta helix superfamily)
MGPFDVDGFVAECLEAVTGADPVGAVREAMARAMRRPQALVDRFPVPTDADDDGVLHRSPELFVACAVFPRGFTTGIHDHATPAIIGVWGGHEDNLLYRFPPDRPGRPRAEGLESSGARRVDTGEVLVLGPETIHDVHAPTGRWSGALHVYLADLPTLERHSWRDPAADAAPFDGADLERRWQETAATTGLVTPG